VLVVWEPILPTDWRPPSGSTLGRIPDGRVRQFWDAKHIVSAELKDRATRTPPSQSRIAAFRKDFTGTKRSCIQPACTGKMLHLLCFGMVLL